MVISLPILEILKIGKEITTGDKGLVTPPLRSVELRFQKIGVELSLNVELAGGINLYFSGRVELTVPKIPKFPRAYGAQNSATSS